jgi:hypothetical protein
LQIVEPVTALSPALHEAGVLEQIEVLGDRLSCHRELVHINPAAARAE